ncbi:hypothetical protein [Paracoccus sp. AK26]|uniref:hypothetical protein n=1 Tax=Paracoccus sp. AK26 TaxID=2589076 RepID=UPI001430D788|nr:hypothetical protein [Paracoccus sp. AK26]
MIPAATIPQVPQMPCTVDEACWVAGTGFRVIGDTGAACAVFDSPLAGKMPVADCASHPLRSLFLTGTCPAEAGASPMTLSEVPAVAAVPLPATGALLGGALAVAVIARRLGNNKSEGKST